MSGQTAALARSSPRHRDNDFFRPLALWGRGNEAGQHRDDKTESGRQPSVRCRNDLMESAAGETAIRQVAIKGGKAERKPGRRGERTSRLPRQQKTQAG